ncbi:ATP-binding protein [Tsukamurella ocularis]|uniref:ATP-binding protein n=1 Tax=Tsukamurella ocularis TaxID=1970234 RepID=UPI002167DB35|nr:ATP-binding protein [Tsukamurella ocularis]MCS3780350.1 hypothetical protein [Tsukamurella ocularis]MCS3786095.1 hypothetical protein [Tsukamurella ocularis]MCS3849459.1 hypothetical protein [Tsukamurella ocularis]
MAPDPLSVDDRRRSEELRRSATFENPIVDDLKTNDRVIARVTDGIYRRPWSAIRELIANAYDADATWVTVKTDAPNFARITVEDDGEGMSPESVVHMLHNIGGSAKRTEQGQQLGLASSESRTQSPAGRSLIGKLGIGMFSVSQLTHSFRIVTKTKGDSYRTVVQVNLRQFADEETSVDGQEFKAGKYQVWRENTVEREAHGTTIVLDSIRPQTRDSLRSAQMWSAIDAATDLGEKSQSAVPLFHIGRLDSEEMYVSRPNEPTTRLPWDDRDSPEAAFQKMADCVWTPVKGKSSVKLEEIFDEYLRMIWNLALALPLPYVDKSVLDETVAPWASFYRISNTPRGRAEKIEIPNQSSAISTLRATAGMSPSSDVATDFRVVVDGVRLSRPIRFRDLPSTNHVLTHPLIFVGQVNEEFLGIDENVSAGPLEFDGYFFWTPKVAPAEHQGVLVRIHGASGTLFDSTFFDYKVAELTRLRQITCEIFVKRGLEAALNIDRESFNSAHPHTVILTRWVHSALRQLATAQKREAQQLREERRESQREEVTSRLDYIVEAVNSERFDGEVDVPEVAIGDSDRGSGQESRDPGKVVYLLDTIVTAVPGGLGVAPKTESIRKLEAIAELLAIYDLMDSLSPVDQESLLAAILGVLEAGDGR